MSPAESTDAESLGVESVITTSELGRRPARAPDFEAENRVLLKLATTIAQEPRRVLQELVDSTRELCHAGSAGISLLDPEEGDLKTQFRWVATSGDFDRLAGNTMPRNFSPCGTVLDVNRMLMMTEPARHYPYMNSLLKPVCEVLLVPFYRGEEPIGTVWVAAHTPDRHFDQEDARLVTSLSSFAAAAIQVMQTAETNQERLGLAIEIGEMASWDWNVRTGDVTWNHRHFLLQGYAVGEVTPSFEAWLARVHPDDRQDTVALIERARHSRLTYVQEFRSLHDDGTIVWCSARGRFFYDTHGQPYRMIGVMEDITARKRTEASLRASEAALAGQREALELALKGSPLEQSLGILGRTAVRLLDHDEVRFAFYLANSERTALHHMVGMPANYAAEVEGFKIGADSVACGLATYTGQPVLIADVMEDPACAPWRELAARYDFRGCWSFPIHSPDGVNIGTLALYWRNPRKATDDDVRTAALITQTAAIIIARDIDTKRREAAEGRQKELVSALHEADRQKDEFLAMLAHELRNPLASIGNAGELLGRVASGIQTDPVLSLLRRQTKQLARLVDDLMDISRIARGRITLDDAPVDIGEVVDRAVETVQAFMGEKKHHFVVTRPEVPVYVRGDIGRLTQAISNVLHNAAKFTDPGGEIRLEVWDSLQEVDIKVTDNGVGISAELLPHVFDLFVQSERTLDRSQGGLGIGLSVVKRLIELQHGSVSVESLGPNHGATFAIRLPRIAAPQAANKPAAVVIRPKRILVVDDNIDAADSLAMLLRLDNHEVHAVYSSEDALKEAQQLRTDVIFLDIGLPRMDGFEVAQRIRRLDAQPPPRLIALTGYGRQEDKDRARESGFDGHIVKPVSPEALEMCFAGVDVRKG